ncbi:hypothetical protein M8997_016230 [Phyllobacterium sp. 21LDTY02-6]|uniref:hypothetical protein n=1 Tax=unclassified Phyllobacterium TaxID=2638441 RepID=UPI0020224265|nr:MULTISPECIES: hypothetical protein [unclassified Phyllobacterium]MCO4318745.1 hypothetical protein [Phyllobacterium sp. 21LDTY02-6]MCX8281990.1 hypothetical protein [Phyllobacterium sp. 0TCS1.6C]MCX8294453.1 hypothetical protein [Phyllobacterium sp. 0TCS1.6A]
MSKRLETLKVLKEELSRLCALADQEGLDMIAYFIETAIRESDEQLQAELHPLHGLNLGAAASGDKRL